MIFLGALKTHCPYTITIMQLLIFLSISLLTQWAPRDQELLVIPISSIVSGT